MDSKLERCEEPDDPLRCKAVHSNQQCPYKAVEGCDNCSRHGANKSIAAAEIKSMKNYRLGQWQARIQELADSGGIKSLREEVGLLRMLLESTVTRCKDEDDLLMASSRISELTKDVDKVLTSCIRIEEKSGQTLDKTLAMNFAAQVIQIIGKHVKDSDILDLIANEIIEALKGI